MGVKERIITTLQMAALVLLATLFTLFILASIYMIFSPYVNLRSGLDYEMSIRGY